MINAFSGWLKREIANLFQPTFIWEWRGIKNTRVSNTALFLNLKNIKVSENVFIGHNAILDGSYGGIEVGEGDQIGHWVHIQATKNKCVIGKYTFIAPGAIILPGIERIGAGCVIHPNTVIRPNMNEAVTNSIPDFSEVRQDGTIADLLKMDLRKMRSHPNLFKNYLEWMGPTHPRYGEVEAEQQKYVEKAMECF